MSMDAPGAVFVITTTEFDAIQVMTDNIEDVMTWLGDDFYALTNGDPISINGTVIAHNDKTNAEPGAKRPNHSCMLVIIKNQVKNEIHVVTETDWIVRDNDIGYGIYTDDVFRKRFRPKKPTVREKAERGLEYGA